MRNDPTPVTSPVVVIGREQSANLGRHSVILQQEPLTGGCGKRSCRWGAGGLGEHRGRAGRVFFNGKHKELMRVIGEMKVG